MKGPMNRIERVERRKHKRFRVQDGSFALLYHDLRVLGQILDIGSDGLAFRYVASKARSDGPSKLKILSTNGSFCLEKVPFKTVWDSAIPREFSFGSITLRHCGVQFAELGHDQKFDLKYFMESYSTVGLES